jgi:methyl-accepting chemotaxis protein
MFGRVVGVNIQTKLICSLGLVLATAAGSSVYSWITAGSIRSDVATEIGESTALMEQAHQVMTGVANMRSAMRGVSLFGLQQKTDLMAKARDVFESTAAEMSKTIQAMEAGTSNPTDKAAAAAIRSALDRWVSYFPEFANLNAAGHADEATNITLKKMSPMMDALQRNVAELSRVNRLRREQASSHTLETIGTTRLVCGMLFAVLVFVGAAAAGIVFGMTKTLRQIITELSGGSQQITAAAGHVASSSQSLAQGASEQAASLEESSASSEEINTMARKNAENSQAAAQLVTSSQQKFVAANQKLEQMVVAMREINASSDKISKIIKVIDEIAFQTNILALNAAVEAARAGEAGMGFAVVADEVRNLAQRSAQAARDTAALIEESIAKSNDGKGKVDDVATTIQRIIQEAVELKDLIDQVSGGSQEQTRGIEQVAQALLQMQNVTQTTAASAEEGAAAAEELAAQSETMLGVAARLEAMVGGAEREHRR